MVYFGKVKNGKIELERRRRLPEGSRVRVEPVSNGESETSLGSFAVDLGVDDLASEHDHYAYGTPKRAPRKSKNVKRRNAAGRRR